MPLLSDWASSWKRLDAGDEWGLYDCSVTYPPDGRQIATGPDGFSAWESETAKQFYDLWARSRIRALRRNPPSD